MQENRRQKNEHGSRSPFRVKSGTAARSNAIARTAPNVVQITGVDRLVWARTALSSLATRIELMTDVWTSRTLSTC